MEPRSFQVTIKGLQFDPHGRLLLLRERTGVWDLPGGRIEHGEVFHDTLRRECMEEMGLSCRILDEQPYWAWTAFGSDGYWKVVLCFRVAFDHLKFTPSEECVACEYFDANGLRRIRLASQLVALPGLLAGGSALGATAAPVGAALPG